MFGIDAGAAEKEEVLYPCHVGTMDNIGLNHGVDINKILYSSKKYEQLMPWDFIQSGIKKEKLWEIWKMTNRVAKGLVEKIK